MMDKIAGAKPADFIRFRPETLARCDREKAAGLIAELRFLRELPEKIAPLETEIKHLTQVWAGRNFTPDRSVIVTRQPAADGGQEDIFDPRQ